MNMTLSFPSQQIASFSSGFNRRSVPVTTPSLHFQGGNEESKTSKTEWPIIDNAAQRWYLAYHFVQILEAIRHPPSLAQAQGQPKDRSYHLQKLRHLVKGTADEILHARPQGQSNLTELSLGEHALALFAAYGSPEDIKLCQERNIHLNAVEYSSLGKPTALMRAVSTGNAETTKALIPFLLKDNLIYRNFYGQTALEIALKKQHKAMIELLRPVYGYFHTLWQSLRISKADMLEELSDEDDESALQLCF